MAECEGVYQRNSLARPRSAGGDRLFSAFERVDDCGLNALTIYGLWSV